MSFIFSPDETILMSGTGTIEQPIQGHGELYLTDKRLFLIHRSGLIRKRETPLMDIDMAQLTYAKTEGIIRKVLIIGARNQSGQVNAFKIHVMNPESWVAHIYNLKNAPAAAPAQPPAQPPASSPADVLYCTQCGTRIPSTAKFCPNCGAPVKS
ncbi:MAG: zinc ribbon domain-containing protein [Nitrososphaerota archaeon]|nr:zinc ribbon domain-containing protein [Nitrososphaerota archaeon]MDG7047560.1 zinc ribbon domain-containing protein [Nitrososphaerota archaeon]MDG7049285.1 zinc ribbon domain-containing protein [Nitrososphaerota archaeon]MDG7052135.1 zinc ribbon domain-containing protein [Nitrososphaerota archaeon]